MRCDKVRERLSDYLDGSLGWLARRRAAAHLDACATCRREMDALRRTVALVREHAIERAPRDVASAVMRRIAMQPAPMAHGPLARPVVLVPAGLALAAVLALQVSVRVPEERTAAADAPSAAYVREYAHFRASQDPAGGAGMFLLASEFSGGPR